MTRKNTERPRRGGRDAARLSKPLRDRCTREAAERQQRGSREAAAAERQQQQRRSREGEKGWFIPAEPVTLSIINKIAKGGEFAPLGINAHIPPKPP